MRVRVFITTYCVKLCFGVRMDFNKITCTNPEPFGSQRTSKSDATEKFNHYHDGAPLIYNSRFPRPGHVGKKMNLLYNLFFVFLSIISQMNVSQENNKTKLVDVVICRSVVYIKPRKLHKINILLWWYGMTGIHKPVSSVWKFHET